MAPAEDKGQAVEDGHHHEEESEPRDQREVLEDSPDDRPEQTRTEGGGGRAHILEALGEDQVGEEDRGKRERRGRHEAQHDRKTQQRPLRDHVSDAQGHEQAPGRATSGAGSLTWRAVSTAA